MRYGIERQSQRSIVHFFGYGVNGLRAGHLGVGNMSLEVVYIAPTRSHSDSEYYVYRLLLLLRLLLRLLVLSAPLL